MSPTHPLPYRPACLLPHPPTDSPPRPATAAGTGRRTTGVAGCRTARARARHDRHGRPEADPYTRRIHARAYVNANPREGVAAGAEVDGG
ncbi:hypothetical protein ACWDBD_33000 [Streptomyces sp. NPDC001118]